MITANELRIGNKIYTANRQIGTIDHIDTNDDTIGIEEDADVFCLGMNPGYAEPIPLTEEWLVKCGFVIGQGTADGYWVCTNGGKVKKIRGMGWGYFDEYHLLREVSSVHGLQNLYFAITDHELNIKP